MKYRNEYDRIVKTKAPEIAVELLAMMCQEKDRRIAELKTEMQGLMVKKEFHTGEVSA